MRMQRLPSKQQNTRVRRERDFRALSRLVLLLCCGLVLAIGFIFAAQQHFAAVQFGYESESLRNERQQLLAEQQRLLLEKEQASNPARLESAARQLGLKPLKAGQVGTQRASQQRRIPLAIAVINPAASFNR
jgi:cell division protein FtsL